MAGQLGHQTRGILLVQPPVDPALQLRRRHLPTPVGVTEPMAAHPHHITDQALPDQPDTLDIFFVIHPLHAIIQHPVARAIGLIDLLALLQGQGHGLLAEHMLAGRHRIQGHPGMEAQRRRDDDTVYLLVFEKFTIIRIGPRRRHHRMGRIQVGLPVVTQGDHLGTGDTAQHHQVILPPGPAADQGQPGLPGSALLRGAFTGLEPGRGRQYGGTARHQAQVFQKPAQSQIHFLTHRSYICVSARGNCFSNRSRCSGEASIRAVLSTSASKGSGAVTQTSRLSRQGCPSRGCRICPL